MTLDQLIIESEIFENIKSQRKKTKFLQYVLKNCARVDIIGNNDYRFIQDFHISNQPTNLEISSEFEIIDLLIQNELEPEQVYVLTHSEKYLNQAKDLEIDYIHRPSNLDEVVKKLK